MKRYAPNIDFNGRQVSFIFPFGEGVKCHRIFLKEVFEKQIKSHIEAGEFEGKISVKNLPVITARVVIGPSPTILKKTESMECINVDIFWRYHRPWWQVSDTEESSKIPLAEYLEVGSQAAH